jgi:hypothetical protein
MMWAELSRNMSSISSDCDSRDLVFCGFGIATGYALWTTGRMRGRSSSSSKVKNFNFSISSIPALGSTHPLIQWILGALSLGGKAGMM